MDARSQCLAQKDAIVKNYSSKLVMDNDEVLIDKNKLLTVDPKTMLIYGNKSKELTIDVLTEDNIIKRETLELQIRDSRNITVISFDELLNRAKIIAGLG